MSRLPALFVLLAAAPCLAAEPEPPPHWLDVSIGARVLHRELTFVDDLFHVLPAYTLPAGPMPSASLEVFPGAAFVKDGIARDLGLSVSFAELVGVETVVENSLAASRRTYATDFDASALGRVLLGPATFTFGAGYVFHRFQFDPPAEDDDAVVPNFTVHAFRTGLRVRLEAPGPLSFEADGGYRFLLGQDAFGIDREGDPYFPRATGGGADASVGLGVALPGGFELRVRGEWRRWFFSLNSEVGDKYVAGGALDESFAGRASLSFRL